MTETTETEIKLKRGRGRPRKKIIKDYNIYYYPNDENNLKRLTCVKCKTEKDLTEFTKNTKQKMKLRKDCIKCRLKVSIYKYFSSNPEMRKKSIYKRYNELQEERKKKGLLKYERDPEKKRKKKVKKIKLTPE